MIQNAISPRKQPFELKLGYLMPAFALIGLVINLEITKPRDFLPANFAPIAVRASHYANYGVDPLDLNFAPIDPAVIDEIRKDANGNPNSNTPADPVIVVVSPTPTLGGPTGTPSSGASPTPAPAGAGLLPTLPPILPTLGPAIPTIVNSLPLVPTILPVVPTVVNSLPVVPTVLPIVPTVVNSIPIVPTVVSPVLCLLLICP